MNGLDLDALRAGWNTSQRQLDASLTLDAQTLRAALSQRTGAAFRRHRGWLLASLIAAAVTFGALLTFIVLHIDDSIYLLLATPLAMLALAELIVDWRQWRALSQLDLSAPVMQVQAVLDQLRGRILRLAKWVMLSSVLLWLPLLLVLVKGLTGFDLLDHLHPSVLYVNLLIGVLFIPVALGVMKWVARHFRNKSGYERLLDDVAGNSFSQARKQYSTQQRFDQALESGDVPAALADRADPARLAAIQAPLRSLKRRLTLALIVFPGLVLATGAFNVLHGGQARFLLPALLLHFTWLAHMLVAILQRSQLAQWRGEAGSLAELRTVMESIIRVRERAERWTLIAAPMLLLALLQVLTRAVSGGDLLSLLVPSVVGGLALLALLATIGLALRTRAALGRFRIGVGAAISLGIGAAARRLLRVLAKRPG